MITQEQLKELLHYDPNTGVFTAREAWGRYSRYPAGTRVGRPNGSGYRQVYIGAAKKSFKEHRLAVLYMTGEWPVGEVDHINRIKDDNRWSNLRVVTRAENRRNLGSSGVYETPGGRWTSRISVNFDTRAEAEAFRNALEKFRDEYEARNKIVHPFYIVGGGQ